MRLLRRGLRVFAAAVITVAVGIAINQVLNGGRWNLWWLGSAVGLAVLAEAADLRLGVRAAVSPILWPSLTGEDGVPLRLGDVTPRDLGAHPSSFSAEGDSPYIRRQADDLLEDVLGSEHKRLIIVQGPRLAGSTRTLVQAARVHLHDHLVVGFVDDPRVPLVDMISQAGLWAARKDGHVPGVMLWLDDLGPGRFAELARVSLGDLPPGVRMLATLDMGELEGLRIPEQLRKVLSQHAILIRLATITEQERRALRNHKAYIALAPLLDKQEDLFLGRIMMIWKPLRKALARDSSEQATNRVALLRAVTDWHRVHMPRLLTSEALSNLYRAYQAELTGTDPGGPISATGFRDALRWAMDAPTADRPRLVDLYDVPDGQLYAPCPLLAVIADDPDEETSWTVADALWSYADRHLRGDQRRDIGYSALARSAREAAARLLSHADATVDPGAYRRVALLFHQRGEWNASRDWWLRSVETGSPEHAPEAMFALGIVEEKEGRLNQARNWYQQAAATDHSDAAPKAMNNLGLLEKGEGHLDQARRWYQQAIPTGHVDAAPKAMVNLGILEEEEGHLDQARHWYQQAIATDHPDERSRAMTNLAALEDGEGHLDQARHWYQQAIATDHPGQVPAATNNLAVLEMGEGHLDQARHWFQQAIATGHPDSAPAAMLGLGLLEAGHGDPGQARCLFQQAIATGHPKAAPGAMNSLGLREGEQGNPGQARHLFQQAIATGDPDSAPKAMINLGVLEEEQGVHSQARHWYQQAIATGHSEVAPRAMLNLGLLEAGHGDPGQARRWYQQAIATGHPYTTRRAQHELGALDRREDEQQRGERFGRYGFLAYADPGLMSQDKQNPESLNVDATCQNPDLDNEDNHA